MFDFYLFQPVCFSISKNPGHKFLCSIMFSSLPVDINPCLEQFVATILLFAHTHLQTAGHSHQNNRSKITRPQPANYYRFRVPLCAVAWPRLKRKESDGGNCKTGSYWPKAPIRVYAQCPSTSRKMLSGEMKQVICLCAHFLPIIEETIHDPPRGRLMQGWESEFLDNT